MFKYHNENVLHITEVELLVKDLKKSVDFYKDILGMHIHNITNDTAKLGTTNKVLLKLKEKRDASKNTRTTGLYHVAYLLDDEANLANFLYNALKHNINFQGFSDHGVSNALYLLDPDLNGIEVYIDLDDSKWFKNNSLELVTRPLNIEHLIKNVNNRNEFKMNNNTIIGHVHFSVNNLDEGINYFKDILGFNLLLKYSTAAFLSDNNYHHHIGINVWQSHNAKPRDNNTTGLISYHLNCKNKSEIIKRLNKNNIKVYNENNKTYFYDINNCIVYI